MDTNPDGAGELGHGFERSTLNVSASALCDGATSRRDELGECGPAYLRVLIVSIWVSYASRASSEPSPLITRMGAERHGKEPEETGAVRAKSYGQNESSDWGSGVA